MNHLERKYEFKPGDAVRLKFSVHHGLREQIRGIISTTPSVYRKYDGFDCYEIIFNNLEDRCYVNRFWREEDLELDPQVYIERNVVVLYLF